jgi:hypothetical protein
MSYSRGHLASPKRGTKTTFVYQYKTIIDVTKLENFTQCPWMFEAKIKFKHYPRTPNGCGRSIAIT